jgi:hypothetical protein
MIALFNKIVAYLTINNIPYNPSDCVTGQPNGEPDQILYWNVDALGEIPTTKQLDDAWVIYAGQEIQFQNKAQAKSLLQATDWTCTVDITNPQYSNPYLANQDEFLTYRSQVRQVAVNPPIDPVTFPPQPDEVWASV